jgi:mono/diheme cytochrome c family protein
VRRGNTKVEYRRMALRSSIIIVLLTLVGVGSSACRKKVVRAANDPLLHAYGTEPDWNNPDKVISLNYQETVGQHVFYQYCVWCHADSSPAGPSNRANLTPTPALMNDGAKLNGLSDEYLRNIITLGGAAMGKSPMMPALGKTLSQEEIRDVIAFARAIAQPSYKRPARAGSQYSEK